MNCVAVQTGQRTWAVAFQYGKPELKLYHVCMHKIKSQDLAIQIQRWFNNGNAWESIPEQWQKYKLIDFQEPTGKFSGIPGQL